MDSIDDQPTGGGKSIIKWDEIDENTNPFEITSIMNNSPLSCSKMPAESAKRLDTTVESNTANDEKTDSVSGKPPESYIESSLQENIRQMRRIKMQQQQLKGNIAPSAAGDHTVSGNNSTESSFNEEELKSINDRIKSANHSTPTPTKAEQFFANGCITSGDMKPKEAQSDSKLQSRSILGSTSEASELPKSGVKLHPSETFSRPQRTSPRAVDRPVMPDDANLVEENQKLQSTIDDMKRCIGEYERTLNQIMSDKHHSESQSRDAVQTLLAERDQALDELSTMERAFGDLHRRFEKTKQVIDAFKANEEALKKSTQDAQSKIKRHEENYDVLKQHAEEKLKSASEEIESLRRSKDSEVARLNAALKRSELHVHSLESQLQQKISENAELTKICDELISSCA